MGFLGNLFRSKPAESVILIDIGAGSVAGACARRTAGAPLEILFSKRLPIEIRSEEPHEKAMLRALELLGAALAQEGAPALARATGSGKVDTILVSVDAPWQETSVRLERVERKTEFVFTRALVKEALKKQAVQKEGKSLSDESVIGTLLNGYETHDPFGRKAHRATVVVLTSFIDSRVAESIRDLFRRFYHTKHILTIAGPSVRYQGLRTAFPHEKDALILDATGPEIAISLVRKGLLRAVYEKPDGTAGTHAWLGEVRAGLVELATGYPLPRTIFVLGRETEVEKLRESLEAANLGSLWVSDDPPRIVSVLASHLSGAPRFSAGAAPDLLLSLMAIYWQNRDPEDAG